MNTRLIFAIGVAILFAGCKPKVNSTEIIETEYRKFFEIQKNVNTVNDSLILSRGKLVCYLQYNSTRTLFKIASKLDDRKYGHFFRFNSDGGLQSYSFVTNNALNSSYKVYKKFLTDTIIEGGSPFVDYMLLQNPSNADSLKVSLFFSTFPRKNLRIEYSTNGIDYILSHTTISSLMPFLSEFDIIVDGKKKNTIFFKIKASKLIDLGVSQQNIIENRTFNDTIILNLPN